MPEFKSAAKKRIHFTIWLNSDPEIAAEEKTRVENAVKSASSRAGYPITTTGWLHVQMMRAVEEEERSSGKAPPKKRR